jgi:UDP-N-acetylmuramyl pentapeptide phosphotransferase/UDP-N-acetylglucosamine-1-phosphate transferase
MATEAELSTFAAVISASIFSFLLTGAATWYARRRGLIDHPGERHSHKMATPRGGGAGLVTALLIVTLPATVDSPPNIWAFCIAPGAFVMAATGWWDDHKSLSARFRFAIQLVVSSYLVWFTADCGWLQGALAMSISLLLVVWMTNLYNFMDGSNGMAGLQGVFAACVLAWLFHIAGDETFSTISILLAACCAGFLPWNLGRARVFMGDVGRLALGFIFAALLLYGAGTGAFGLPVVLMLMLVFVADSTLTLLRRVMRGEQWYNAHRQHLYQRLIASGWTHGQVALIYQAINLTLVFPGIVVAVNFPTLAWPVTLFLVFVLILGWCLITNKLGVLARAG